MEGRSVSLQLCTRCCFQSKPLAGTTKSRAISYVFPTGWKPSDIKILFINNNVSDQACIGVDPCPDHEPAGLCFFSVYINNDVRFISRKHLNRWLSETLLWKPWLTKTRNIWKWIKARRI